MARKILLVEADKASNESLKALLITNGYLVETTHKGSEALLLIKKVKPDLVIVDPTLSDMTGEAVCRSIRKEHCSLPIVIVSAESIVAEKITGLKLGTDDYCTPDLGHFSVRGF
jgi:DNA-binding response OmpR family regulator